MAIVYNSRYIGDFCDKYGNNVIITLKHREVVPDEGVILTPIPTRIKFVGHDESPVVISYKGADNDYKLEPLNGSECTLNILADDDFQLSDLYTADEKEWMIVISGAYSWSGFVIPDSCSEPFAYKPYPVTISATDGLGLLKDIPYANEDGTIYRGFNSDRNILKIALEKTGLSLDMVCGVNTYDYTMVIADVTNPLDLTFIDNDRFIDEDGLPFSCYEVIRSICARWSARLHQVHGRWQIVNAMELSQGDVRAYRYDLTGLFKEVIQLVNTVYSGGLDRNIQSVGNTEMAKAFKQSVGYYQYGYIANQLFNGDMNLWTNNPNGLPDGWEVFGSTTVNATTHIRQSNGINTTDYSILFNDVGDGGIRNVNPVQIRANQSAAVTCDFWSPNSSFGSSNRNTYISFLIQSDNGKYYTNSGWQDDYGYYVIVKSNDDMVNQLSLTVNVSPLAYDYQMTFGILPAGELAPVTHYFTYLNNVSIKPLADETAKPPIGSFTKLESTAAQSYKPDPIVLLHSDDRNEQRTSLINIGTADSGSNPTGWYRNGIIESKTLLEVVADTELRLHSRPYRIFDAIFYGTDAETGLPTDLPYIDVNTLLSVDLLGSAFIFLSGDFDLKTGNHSLRFAEVLLDDVAYEETTAEDYGDIADKNSVGSPTGVSVNVPSSYVDTSSFVTNDKIAYFIDNIDSPIPIKHVWFGTTAQRNALTAIDPYTYYVLTDSLTPVPTAASNVETQAGTVTDKYVSPSTLANWWSYIKGLAQTISGIWNFTARPTYNGVALITDADIRIGGTNYVTSIPSNWESGYWERTNGAAIAGTGYIRSKTFYPVKPSTEYTVSSDYRVAIIFYTSAGVFISSINKVYTTKAMTFTTPSNATQYKIWTCNVAETAITVDFIATAKVKLEIGNKNTDWSLSTSDILFQETGVISSTAIAMSIINEHQVFTGTTATWTAPVVTGNTWQKIFVKNRGTGILTINSNGGATDFYFTSAVASIQVNPGDAVILINDGTYWNIN